MQYVTSVERIGIKKSLQQGLRQGLQQGETRVLRRLLTRRFGELPVWADAKLQTAALEQLETWSERVLEARSLGSGVCRWVNRFRHISNRTLRSQDFCFPSFPPSKPLTSLDTRFRGYGQFTGLAKVLGV